MKDQIDSDNVPPYRTHDEISASIEVIAINNKTKNHRELHW